MYTRDYISEDKIQKIAIRKYQENGLGITFQDIEREFSVNKGKAQRTLKHFHRRDVLFTANDLRLEGIISIPNKSPQQYFATCIKAEIIEVNGLVASPSSKLVSATSNDLEGYLLPLLPQAPIFLHNFHFKIGIDPECYES